MNDEPNAESGPSSLTDGEDSGLSDIKQIAAALKSVRRAESQEIKVDAGNVDEDDVLPAFGGGFGSLAATSLVPESGAISLVASSGPPKNRVTADPTRSRMGLLVGLAAVTVAFVAAGVALTLTSGPDQAAENEPTTRAEQAARDVSRTVAAGMVSPASEPVAELIAQADVPTTERKPDESLKGEPAADEPSGREVTDARPRRTTTTESTKSSATAPPPTKPTEAGAGKESDSGAGPTPASAPAKAGGDIAVDCILNPDRPECGGGAQKKTQATKADDGDLPDKLSAIHVRNGFGAVKTEAKACGPRHGVAAGTKISIKVSISGQTGAVESAQAVGEHAGTAIGKCVSEALSRATFPRFSSPVMGLNYSVVL